MKFKLFGHKHLSLAYTGNTKPNQIIVCSPALIRTWRIGFKSRTPKKEWRDRIRKQALEDIIKIIDKRNEHDQKLAYYKRETLIKELSDLT